MAFGQAPKRKLLVVDDNPDAARMLALLLRKLGHDVETASDGTAAIAFARRMRPDYVFLDLALPGVDGFRVAETLRADPAFEHMRIVAITGSGREEDRDRSRLAGIDLYLIKPVDPRFVESLVGDASVAGKEP
jgi:CheY-like chemotaxis protein